MKPENEAGQISKVEVLRPLKGSKQFSIQPIIRSVSCYNFSLSPVSNEWNMLVHHTNKFRKTTLIQNSFAQKESRNNESKFRTIGNQSNDMIKIYRSNKGFAMKNYITNPIKSNQRTSSATLGMKHKNPTSQSFIEEKEPLVLKKTISKGAYLSGANQIKNQKAQIKEPVKAINANFAKHASFMDQNEKIKSQKALFRNMKVNKQVSVQFIQEGIPKKKGRRISTHHTLKKNIFNFNIHA